MRAMLAASSGMDWRGVVRTLRLERRGSNCERGTKIRFLVGSATSSGAAASMATASVLSMAFMVITPIGSGMQQREKRQGLLPAPDGLGSKGDSGFQLAQAKIGRAHV